MWLANLKDSLLGNCLIECCTSFKVHFDMSHNYGSPLFYNTIKHEQPGTGFLPVIPMTVCHQTSVGNHLDSQGLIRKMGLWFAMQFDKAGGQCWAHHISS